MNAPPKRPPYLFYSPKCVHCNQLIELIKRNQQLSRVVEPVNVHTTGSLPPQLDSVPAILFNGQLLIGPDTFKWVQMQTPRDNRPQNREQRPSIAQRDQGVNMDEGLDGIPEPADISSATKFGIDFTPLPGQQKEDISRDSFTFLPGQGGQADGTDGIDYNAAFDDNNSQKNRGSGMDQQMQQLQNLRGQDNSAIQSSLSGPYNQIQQQMAPWQQQQQQQQEQQMYNGANYGNMGSMTQQPGNYPPQNSGPNGYGNMGQQPGW